MMNTDLPAVADQSRLPFDFYTLYQKHREFHALGTQAKERRFLEAHCIGKTMAWSLEVCMHWTGHRY